MLAQRTLETWALSDPDAVLGAWPPRSGPSATSRPAPAWSRRWVSSRARPPSASSRGSRPTTPRRPWCGRPPWPRSATTSPTPDAVTRRTRRRPELPWSPSPRRAVRSRGSPTSPGPTRTQRQRHRCIRAPGGRRASPSRSCSSTATSTAACATPAGATPVASPPCSCTSATPCCGRGPGWSGSSPSRVAGRGVRSGSPAEAVAGGRRSRGARRRATTTPACRCEAVDGCGDGVAAPGRGAARHPPGPAGRGPRRRDPPADGRRRVDGRGRGGRRARHPRRADRRAGPPGPHRRAGGAPGR